MRGPRTISACLLAFVWGCTPSSSEQADLATPPDAAIGCSESSHRADQCDTDVAFTSSPDFPVPLDHHGTAIIATAAGSFLYVTGGTNYHTIFKSVYVAPISADGTLGPWKSTTPLPAERAGHGIAVAHGRLIVVSGQDIANTYPVDVWGAAANPDGTLGVWSAEPSVPLGRFHGSVATTDTDLYFTGGVDSQMSSAASVFHAPIHDDGTLGAFVTETSLPVGRSHHAAVARGGYLYIAGGHGGAGSVTSTVAEVLSAPITNGTLGAFSTVATLDSPRDTPSAFPLDEQLVLVGGMDDAGDYLGDVLVASFGAEGALGPFATLPGMLPVGRAHVHQTPLTGDRFYSIGGSVAPSSPTRTVEIGAFSWKPKAGG